MSFFNDKLSKILTEMTGTGSMGSSGAFGWHYPAGAENDPRAPWNQIDSLPCPKCKQDSAAPGTSGDIDDCQCPRCDYCDQQPAFCDCGRDDYQEPDDRFAKRAPDF